MSFKQIRAVLISAVALVAAIALNSSASAAVIYNNGSPLLAPVIAQGAMFANQGNSSFTEVADDFILSKSLNVIRDIHWWGTYNIAAPTTDSFAIKIYNDNAGTVGSLNTTVSISSLVRTLTTDTIAGRPMYSFDAAVSDITLTAGTKYWLGISQTGASSLGWGWVINANSGSGRVFSSSSGNWSINNKTLAFNLTDTIVPEPGTLALGLIGIAGLAAFRAVRRRTDLESV